ncbi:MAG: hypothetical protein IPK16_02815 [Anaerolineales bacterium]|nr:hypothetical protein [Anaerolineales bacterium]
MSKRHLYRPLFAILLFALVFSASPVQAAPASQALPPGSQYTVGDCRGVDKQTLRDEIERHALDVIASGAAPLDIDGLVARKWQELEMDAVVDGAVQKSVDNLMVEEAYLDKLLSGWWGEKAQEYAERIANDAFSSPAFQVKLTELSEAIGAEVARQVEGQFAQAASVALLCLQEYVGEQYSRTLFDAFQGNVQRDVAKLDFTVENAPVMQAIDQHGLAIAGVGTIIVTQLTYRLTLKLSEKIAQRVAGKVTGRVLGKAGSSLIPVAGWIIGIAMIAYDLWEGNQGALPQIQEALQSEEVKLRIRSEIASAIKDDLPDQASLIALETSVSLLEQWQGFCNSYDYICSLAERNADFGAILDGAALNELGGLATLVGWYMDQAGGAELDRVIADGTLERLLALPAATVDELTSANQPHVIDAWLALTGDKLPEVLALGIHHVTTPDQLDGRMLSALLALPDAASAKKVLSLAPRQQQVLLALAPTAYAKLVSQESAVDLARIANQMLQPEEKPAQIADDLITGKVAAASLGSPTPSFATPGGAALAARAPISASGAVIGSASGDNFGLQQSQDNGRIWPFSTLLVVIVLVAGASGAGYLGWRRTQAKRAERPTAK